MELREGIPTPKTLEKPSSISDLKEGEIAELPTPIDTEELTTTFNWGSMKVVFDSPVEFKGNAAVLKMYRDPEIEDEKVESEVAGVGTIVIHPHINMIEEPPLGTVELSEYKRYQYQLARQFFGEQVPDTSFFVATDQTGKLRNWEIQDKIDGQVMTEVGGVLPFLENNAAESALEIINKAEKMFQQTGRLPDFHGNVLGTENIVVSATGDCYLVDTDGQLIIAEHVVKAIHDRGESLYSDGVLHSDIVTWMETNESVDAKRCQDMLKATLFSFDQARQFLHAA